jgi:hypothetical protein
MIAIVFVCGGKIRIRGLREKEVCKEAKRASH